MTWSNGGWKMDGEANEGGLLVGAGQAAPRLLAPPAVLAGRRRCPGMTAGERWSRLAAGARGPPRYLAAAVAQRRRMPLTG